MPSINEVWEQALQINANLVTVHHDLEALKSCCTDELATLHEQRDWLEAIHVRLGEGFANLSDGLAGVQSRQDVTNHLLKYQVLQNQTMICLLEKIARNTCDLSSDAERQTRIQTGLATDLGALVAMTETVHPDAALVQRRAVEQRRALDKCCPPEPARPRCTFEPCREPELAAEPKPRPATVVFAPAPRTQPKRHG